MARLSCHGQSDVAKVSGHEWDSIELLFWASSPAWHRQAACKGMDPAMFYPERRELAAPAIKICASCTVRDLCDEAGESESQGIWGGRPRSVRIGRKVRMELP